MARLIRANTVEEAYHRAVNHVMEYGSVITDERGSRIREVLNLVIEIKKPLDTSMRVNSFWNGEKLEKYQREFLDKDKHGFVYTYGNRLRGHFKVDQIDEIIKRLKGCKESRRATAVTWDPRIDPHRDEVPCLILVDFKIRNNLLNVTGVWRSHDIYGAYYPNLKGLVYLAEYVAHSVDVPVGTVTVQSISAHCYEINWKEALELKIEG